MALQVHCHDNVFFFLSFLVFSLSRKAWKQLRIHSRNSFILYCYEHATLAIVIYQKFFVRVCLHLEKVEADKEAVGTHDTL